MLRLLLVWLGWIKPKDERPVEQFAPWEYREVYDDDPLAWMDDSPLRDWHEERGDCD